MRSQSFKLTKSQQQNIALRLMKLNERCNCQRKGYFHSTTSMHIFRTGFLRLRKSRARGGRSGGGLPGLRGGRFGAACCLPLALALPLLLLLLVLLLLLMLLLVVLMAVALSAVCQADDNGLPLGDVSQCTCALTTTETENNDGQKRSHVNKSITRKFGSGVNIIITEINYISKLYVQKDTLYRYQPSTLN